jgi:hypothetical protein
LWDGGAGRGRAARRPGTLPHGRWNKLTIESDAIRLTLFPSASTAVSPDLFYCDKRLCLTRARVKF